MDTEELELAMDCIKVCTDPTVRTFVIANDEMRLLNPRAKFAAIQNTGNSDTEGI